MASYTTVTRARVRLATNTPGGPVYEAVRKTVKAAKAIAVTNAPVGNPGDYLHRAYFPTFFSGPAVPGTYKASFSSDIRGSRGSRVVGNLRNDADHADIVELGRSATTASQTFATANRPPLRALSAGGVGDEVRAALVSTNFTRARPGKHIMGDALDDAAQAVLGVGAARRISVGDVVPSRFVS